MNAVKNVCVLFAAFLFAAPGLAQVDLPIEYYGDKIEINTSNIPDLDPDDFRSLFMTVSSDGQILAFIESQQLYIGQYPDYMMSPVFNIYDTEYEYPHDDYFFDPVIHPNNTSVAYVTRIYDPDRGGVYDADTTFASDGSIEHINRSASGGLKTIAIVNIYTGECDVLVVGGFAPQWSPDGRFLVYLMDEYYEGLNAWESAQCGNFDWAIYDMVTKQSTPIRELLNRERFGQASMPLVPSLVFSPDGASIFYSETDIDSSSQVFRASLDGASVEQITSFAPLDSGNRVGVSVRGVSPDDRWLVLEASTQDHEVLGKYMVIYDMVNDKAFSLLTGEELSCDLVEIEDYEIQYVETYGEGYHEYLNVSLEGEIISYTINDIQYDYNEFHFTKPSFTGWSSDGEKTLILGSAMNDYGLFYKPFDPEFYKSSPTVVADATPTAFPTIANYPNPFNPATTLTFMLPSGGHTEISVYNLAGQKIRDLVAGHLTPGAHEVVWDGRDMQGIPVSSGVFFSQLKSGDTVVTDRMTLVK